MAKILKEPRQFICDICARAYHNVSNLKRHVRKFHSDGPENDPLQDEPPAREKVQCLICNKEFAIRSSLYRHYRKFHPGESFPSLECVICAKEFSNSLSLASHNNRCHLNAENDLSASTSVKIECDKCGETFRFQSTFRRHYERFHTEIIWIPQKSMECSEPLECAECGRKFSHKSNLKRHLQKLHPYTMACEQNVKVEINVCDICFASFYDSSSLTRHKRTIHENKSQIDNVWPEVNEFECFHCSEKFDRKEKIRKHIFRWHVPPLYHIRPMCDQCGQSFHNTSNLARHKAKKHADGGSKSLVVLKKIEAAPAGLYCDVCGHNFFSIRTLRQHRRRIHGLDDIIIETVNPHPVKVQCEECNKLFCSTSNLQRHKKQHHNKGKSVDETVNRILSALCIECGRSFFNKSSLKRHQHKAHPNFIDDSDGAAENDPNKALCEECNHYFHDKSTLYRHIKKIHGVKSPIIVKTDQSDIIIKEHFCELCERYFSNNTSLMRHKVVIHSFIDQQTVKSLLRPNLYECSFCPKQFQRKLQLSAHMREKHPKKSCRKPLLEARLCELCGQNFANKSCLLRHKRTIHRGKMNPDSSSEDEVEKFECYHCNRSFRRKDSLVSHIRAKHPVSDDGSNLFECNECGKNFTRKHAIRRHLLTIHAHNEVKTANFRCTLCPSAFHLRHIARAHYEREHGIQMETEKLKFETIDEFEDWRKEVQRKYVTMFVRCYISKTSEYVVTRYNCHRSGLYRDHSKTAPRKRSLKEWGSKKIQGYCPAEIMLQLRDDGCHVQFQSVHVGHEIGSRDELHHVFLDKEQKRMVAEQLIEGVPRTEIVKSLNLSLEQQESLGRLSILNFKDVDNIARSFGIRSRRRARSTSENGGPPAKRRRRSPTSDATEVADEVVEPFVVVADVDAAVAEQETSVESYVMQNKDAFLFFKSQGEEDTVFGTLNKDDYLIVLMDQSQAENLQRYGHKVVAFDGTHTADRYQFVLHTLLVMNANGEGIPVAFLVSNRRDQAVIDIFIRCVQERVGTIAPQTLISDMQTTYYTGWVSYMEPPQFYLFCSSHVNEAWRRFAAKIRSKEKRVQLLEQLVNIEQELDEVLFEQKLTAFMSNTDRDLRDFMEYFGSFFYENTKHWAWCYRKFAGVNTNSLINEFHHCTLRQKVAGGKRIRTLSEGLKYLEAYMTLKGDEKLCKDFHGWGLLRKCDDLKKNHQLAADYCAEKVVSIVPIDEQTWQIVSFQPNSADNEIFTVDRVDQKECDDGSICELLCAECNICLHEYRCSCVESCIHSNMCKHIHVLGFYLQTHQLLELKEVEMGDCMSNVENLVEVDVPVTEVIATEECINEEISIDSCIKEVFTDEGVVYEEIPEILKEEDVKKEEPEEGCLDQVKVQILQEVQNALNTATAVPNLVEIRERFIQPLKLKLMDDVMGL